MLVDWLSNQDLKDSESVIIKGAAIVVFAGSVFVINELFFWQPNLLLLAGISAVAGIIGFLVAKTFPVLIKVLPVVLVLALAASGAKGLYDFFYFKHFYIEPFLAKTDNCKALGLELVNKHNLAACVAKDSKTIRQSCQHVVDNEWSCSVVSWSDVIAEPGSYVKATPDPETL